MTSTESSNAQKATQQSKRLSTSSAWQPPSIPVTVGASFQSWLRPSGSSTPASRSPTRSPSRPASAASDRKVANDVMAEEIADATLPDDPAAAGLLPPSNITLKYRGRYDQLAAQAELWLYSLSTPYFRGAQLGNVNNRLFSGDRNAFTEMWRETQAASSASSSLASGVSGSSAKKANTYSAEQRATMGTELHSDGKVGSIRWVSVDGQQTTDGLDQAGGWLSWVPTMGSTRPERCLNVLEIGIPATPEQRRDTNEESIVLLHGYGAGTGFFFQNISALASRPNSRLYALDWLGMGRSSRPTYQVPSSAMGSDKTRVEAAESFFVDSLEAWRRSAGVEKMSIVAHSLGGYLSVAYALRYPSRVSRLILVSPAGCGADPAEQGEGNSDSTFSPKNADYVPEKDRNNVDADAASVHSIEREVLEPQGQAIDGAPTNTKEAQQNSSSNAKGPPRFSPRMRSFFGYLWEKNFSPFGILRTSGFLGPYIMSGYTRRRFGALEGESLKALHGYCQGIFLAKGSGEYCLAHLLMPGAWARLPMITRVDPLPKTLPVTFVYGSTDWMDIDAGRAVVKRLKETGNPNGKTYIVAHAGHHLYLDNPRSTDRLLAKLLDGQEQIPEVST